MGNKKRNKLLKHQQFYIDSFIDTFLMEKRRPLWRTALLEMEPAHWNRISTWDLWDESYAIVKYCKQWNNSLHSLLETSFLNRYKNRIVLVVCIGHDKGRIEYRMLREILLKEIFILDGLILIEPYYLALAINHDGEVCVCQKLE